MKKIILSMVAILMAVSMSAQSGESIYRKYSGKPGVTGVYISPAMFRMMGSLPSLGDAAEGVDVTKLVQSLDAMYVLECETPAIAAEMEKEVRKMVSSGKYELMMEAKDDGEKVSIYTVKKGTQIESFVFLCAEKDGELSFIAIDGNISESELDKLIASMSD